MLLLLCTDAEFSQTMSIIINELLCYMLSKIDSVPLDVICKLVSDSFTDDEVEAAKCLLCDHVEEALKMGIRRGQNKKKMYIDGMAKILLECDRANLPKFVALDLSKLPPITVDCIDVSSLMRKQQLMEVEMSSMKEMIHDILKVTSDMSKRVEAAAMRVPSIPERAHEQAENSSPKLTDKTYVEAAQAAASRPQEGEWTVANRMKRGSPAARKQQPVGPASVTIGEGAAAPDATASVKTSHPGKSPAVIGAKKAGPFKAVTAVRRFSMFMSRLPPGTGVDSVTSYVLQQSRAESVTAEKLPTRYDSYESYRLDLINPPADVNLLDPQLWAQGLVIRRFFQKRQARVPNERS